MWGRILGLGAVGRGGFSPKSERINGVRVIDDYDGLCDVGLSLRRELASSTQYPSTKMGLILSLRLRMARE